MSLGGAPSVGYSALAQPFLPAACAHAHCGRPVQLDIHSHIDEHDASSLTRGDRALQARGASLSIPLRPHESSSAALHRLLQGPRAPEA
jgi:hypothetical protein